MPKTAFSYARAVSPEDAAENIQKQLQAIRDFTQKQNIKIIEEFQEQRSAF